MATNYTDLSEQASVSEVLKLVVLEHRELRTQYREVTTRIRNLRIAVRTLRSLGGRSAPAARGEESKVSIEDELAAEEPAEFQADAAVCRDDSALSRAIRIAVFETFDVVSIQEIYTRILRRGSFSFPRDEFATQAIEEELTVMVERGELRRVESSTLHGWQRSPSIPVASTGL